jgi:general secretion pathway protein B
MSILLQALRKSEKNQRLREAPTIHTDNQPGPVSEPLPTGLLVLLLVAALFICGWFVWHQYQPPTGDSQPPAALAAEKFDTASQPVVEDKQGVQAATRRPPANTSREQNRTPVESYQPDAGGDALPAPAAKGSAVAENTNKDIPTPKPPMKAGPEETTSPKVATEELMATVPEPFHPGEPAPISYWELPDSVRSSVPEIKFSVLVYAAKPADRFVLINGQRLGEGDTAQPGLVVKEIRRDGVVFNYRLYQFLVEK